MRGGSGSARNKSKTFAEAGFLEKSFVAEMQALGLIRKK